MDGDSEAVDHGLYRSSPHALLVVDRSATVRLANQPAAELFGPGRRLTGSPLAALLPGLDLAPEPPRRRCEAVRDDGTTFPADVVLTELLGGASQTMLVVIDATESDRDAAAHGLVAAVVRSASDAVVSIDRDLGVVLWNPAAERLFGYTAEEVAGTDVRSLFTVDNDAQSTAALRRALAGESVDLVEVGRVRKDGRRVVVDVSLSPLLDSSGQVVGVTALARDPRAGATAERRFARLLEAAPDGMMCVSSDGVILQANRRAADIFGYDDGELTGHSVEDLVPPELRAAHGASRSLYAKHPTGRPIDAGLLLSGVRKDGSTFPAEVSLSPIDQGDRGIVVAAVRDVTDAIAARTEREQLRLQAEHVRLQAELAQAQKLESLGQLAGGVAHDFNNLLGVIRNYTRFAIDQLRESPEDAPSTWRAAVADLEQVDHAAERAASLTHQLLAFARHEVVQPEALDLDEVIRSVAPLTRQAAGELVDLQLRLGGGLGLVLFDRGKLEQVLVNLAVNARDAMPTGGSLVVETDMTPAADEGAPADLGPGALVRLRVSDSGPGMPPDVLGRAFEPFFTTKPKGQGTGLGLATVYGVITQAGGQARLDSEPGQGTTFTALLPTTPHSGARLAAPAPAAADHVGAGTVLVVEDEPAVLELTRRILLRHGYDVLGASTGAEALDLLADAKRIDLLVTDVVMPQMFGNDLASRVLTVSPGTPVLYMSGYAEGMVDLGGRVVDDASMLEKPFTEDELLAGVRGAMLRGKDQR